MFLDTGFCNVSSAAMKWHGTTQNMSFDGNSGLGMFIVTKQELVSEA